MRNMSFMATTEQIRNRTKTVTRRLGWKSLKRGDLIQAIEKGQGLKKGEKVNRLAVLRVENVRREKLSDIVGNTGETAREGFQKLTGMSFVLMFCDLNRPCKPDWEVTRIEFSYVDQPRTSLGDAMEPAKTPSASAAP